MSIRNIVEQVLERAVWTLHRVRLLRATVINSSEQATRACARATQHGSRIDSGTPANLLDALLHDPGSGFARCLESLGVNMSEVAPSDRSVRLGALIELMRRSYDVVPVERVAGKFDRWQTLHTVHFIWGFACDESSAGKALRERCPSLRRLERDSIAWTQWYDAG